MAVQSCSPHTLWMRPTYSVTASPSWREESCSVAGHHFSSRTNMVKRQLKSPAPISTLNKKLSLSIRSRCWISYGDSKGCSLQCERDHASCSHVRSKCNIGELCWGRTFIHLTKRKHQHVSHFSIMRFYYHSLPLSCVYNFILHACYVYSYF